jgi:hypothetical protein
MLKSAASVLRTPVNPPRVLGRGSALSKAYGWGLSMAVVRCNRARWAYANNV